MIKRLLYGAVWCFCFGLLGALLALSVGASFNHGKMPHRLLTLASFGAEFGTDLFFLGYAFAVLPRAKPPNSAMRPFGPAQGLWGMAGFLITMTAGALLLANLLICLNLLLIICHIDQHVNLSGHAALAGSALAGESVAGLWVAWYVRRFGEARLFDGSTNGIGWCKAPRDAYVVSALMAAIVLAFVLGLYHFVPPDFKKLQSLPVEQLFTGSAISVLPILILAVFAAPALEEFVFRGIGFAGLSVRLGPLWAGTITTIAFMAVHAPEKIYYPLGFIDVGMMAAGSVILRVRYRSIRPSIMLHILYNGGGILATALFT
jgi:membrane protease YdiL (CAAX protease family)